VLSKNQEYYDYPTPLCAEIATAVLFSSRNSHQLLRGGKKRLENSETSPGHDRLSKNAGALDTPRRPLPDETLSEGIGVRIEEKAAVKVEIETPVGSNGLWPP